jgi:hypothetical protein
MSKIAVQILLILSDKKEWDPSGSFARTKSKHLRVFDQLYQELMSQGKSSEEIDELMVRKLLDELVVYSEELLGH